MKRQVMWSEDALAEVDDHVTYIASENKVAAERILTRLYDAASALALSSTGRWGHEPDTYEKVVLGTPYIIVYALPDDRPIVKILHVFHGAQNWWGDH